MDESVTKYLEQPKVGTLKLSEAIRIGARMSGPAFGVFSDAAGKTCAQGAALLAIGKLSSNTLENHRTMERIWKEVPGNLRYAIAGMNNSRTHTREQIADWLEAQGH